MDLRYNNTAVSMSRSGLPQHFLSPGPMEIIDYTGVPIDEFLRKVIQKTDLVKPHPKFSSTWVVTSPNTKPSQQSLLIEAAIHGKEACGINACVHVLQKFASRDFVLPEGKLTICIANEEAVLAGRRNAPPESGHQQEDMNRLFGIDAEVQNPYLKKRIPEVRSLIDDCSAFFDLHSVTPVSPSFTITHPRDQELARVISPDFAYLDEGLVLLSKIPGAALSYAISREKQAIVLECGQHKAKDTFLTAIRATENFLSHFGVERACVRKSDQVKVLEPIRFQQKIVPDNLDSGQIDLHYNPELINNEEELPANFTFVKRGQPIATETGPNGHEVNHVAGEDCYIFLVSHYHKQPELGYLWIEARAA